MRWRVRDALNGQEKHRKTMEYVGCDAEALREYLESKFLDGMTWENKHEFHIDHIRPCASFDLDNEVERHKCFHYTNLQPLWAADNLSKGATVGDYDTEWTDYGWR